MADFIIWDCFVIFLLKRRITEMRINNSAPWPTPPLRPASCSLWARGVETCGQLWPGELLFPRAISEGAAALEVKSFCLQERRWVPPWTQSWPGILAVPGHSGMAVSPSICLLILFSPKCLWICL